MGERERAYEERLLTELQGKLEPRGISTVLIVDRAGRYCLEVVDCHYRIRRVYIHLSFLWFYWGDESDERVSLFDLELATDRIEQAAGKGWHQGEQGEIRVDLGKIADAHRS